MQSKLPTTSIGPRSRRHFLLRLVGLTAASGAVFAVMGKSSAEAQSAKSATPKKPKVKAAKGTARGTVLDQ